MTITKKSEGSSLIVALEGRLDTNTAPQLDQELKQSISGVTDLTIDMAALTYISSAGLRVLLTAQKTMNKQGSLVIKNARESIMEVFEVTGFSDILTIA